MKGTVNLRYPGGRLAREWISDPAGWQALRLRTSEWKLTSADIIEPPPSDDPSFSLLLNTTFRLDECFGGRWRGQRYTKGTGELSPSRHQRRLRQNFAGQGSLNTLGLHIPLHTVDRVAQELSKPGKLVRSALSDIPFLNDRTLSRFTFSVAAALREGAPDFYAQSAAQWLSAHLLLGPFKAFEWHESLSRQHFSDHRLIRVLEYVEAHLSEPLDLRTLSKEAGLSPFHFAALFSRAVGVTPHRHVHHLRLKTAKSMLRETGKSILEIALACGFGSASHFSSSFRREFSESPTEYRSSRRFIEVS
jgi:AraC family transcriptional regulator